MRCSRRERDGGGSFVVAGHVVYEKEGVSSDGIKLAGGGRLGRGVWLWQARGPTHKARASLLWVRWAAFCWKVGSKDGSDKQVRKLKIRGSGLKIMAIDVIRRGDRLKALLKSGCRYIGSFLWSHAKIQVISPVKLILQETHYPVNCNQNINLWPCSILFERRELGVGGVGYC